MKWNRFLLFNIFCLFFATFMLYSIDKNTLLEKAEMIREKEKMKYSCKLSDDESYKALQVFLDYKKVTLKTFEKIVERMSKIVQGLYLVIEKKSSSSQAYENLQLSKYNITKETWNHYVTKYDSQEKIDDLKRMIPNNMDIIINSGKKVFALGVENWLLEQYILKKADNSNATMTSTTNQDKIKLFWKKILENYNFDETTKKELLSILSKESNFTSEESEMRKKHFKDRI